MENTQFFIFENQSFVDLGLYQYGWEICEPGHSFGPAKRNHYLFHYIFSGQGVLMADDKKGQTVTYQLREGQGFLLFPGQTSTYIADNDDPWRYMWVEFDGLRVKEALEVAGISQNNPVYARRSTELAEKMKEEMRYLITHHDESTLQSIGHFYLFFDYYIRSQARGQQVTRNQLRDFYIREAIAYIESHYQEDVSIEHIAEVLGLHRSYFGKLFKSSVGRSPQQFLMNYRMVKAADLLALTKSPIHEVGAAVGYPNQMHFSRAFKTIYGCSPSQWRKDHQYIPTKMNP